MLRYAGIDRNGVSRSGATQDSAVVVAERLFDRRFLSARITDTNGRVLGGVGKDEGRRVWWAEDDSLPFRETEQTK